MASYFRPTELTEALAALADREMTVVAGATDYYPAQVGDWPDHDIMDLAGIESLAGITADDDHWRIGAMTTWRDLMDADLPGCFEGLKVAARQVGGPQIQNCATLVGNLCNASPAADGVPPLLTLDARVVIQDVAGEIELPIADFIKGNRRTALTPGQLVTAILVPRTHDQGRSGFLKLGARSYLVISIVMVAGVVILDDQGAVMQANLSVGSCSEVALRLSQLENDLVGHRPDAVPVTPAHFADLSPLDDHRGTAAYRLDAAQTMTRRLLVELGS